MDISKNLKYNKDVLLSYFRNRSNEIKSELALRYSAADYKKKAAAVNTAMIQTKETLLSILLETARNEHWTNKEILECVLMITYTNDVVMLEARNSVWESMNIWRFLGEWVNCGNPFVNCVLITL